MLKVRDKSKMSVENIIKADVDVQYQWDEVCEYIGDREKVILLDEIVCLYVTIRGFSFAKSWLEMFKKDSKSGVQKSKGLRKKVSEPKV